MVMANDPLSDALNVIKTHEIVGRRECHIRPASKLIKEVLSLFQAHNYIGDFEMIDDGKSGSFKVKLLGRINNCKTIKPRFAVKNPDWNKWEQRYIPGKGFGILVVSTSMGVMTNSEAQQKKIGGRLIAFIY
jgi:small subunit ribosomal protein S8